MEDDQVHGESPRLLGLVQQLELHTESQADSSQEHSDSHFSDADLQAVHREDYRDSGLLSEESICAESGERSDIGGSSDVPPIEDSACSRSQTEDELVRYDQGEVLQGCSPPLGGGIMEAKRSTNSRRGKKARRGKAGGRS